MTATPTSERRQEFDPCKPGDRVDTIARIGRISQVMGTIIRARIPNVSIGERCEIRRGDSTDPLVAEVIGFDEDGVVLMPYGAYHALSPSAQVIPQPCAASVPCGPALLGRVIDSLGRPLDNLGPLPSSRHTPIIAEPPNPLDRTPIDAPVETGVRAIDALLTVGRGQRVGIFAAAGAGKSTLLGMIARNMVADSVVVALIGERGREVRPFIQRELGVEGLAKATVVVSTSDQPALMRVKAAFSAVALAEERRRRGEHVLLLMDSVTRFARALREVGLAAGEPPGRQGYPPSVFATLPTLFERCGNDDRGSITAFFTVLVAGDDIEEPVADETISLLDGHLILSRRLAATRHFPAIDVVHSESRVMQGLVSIAHRDAAARARKILELYERNYDKILCGVYEPGIDDALDDAVRRHDSVSEFLRQDVDDRARYHDSVERLVRILEMDGAQS